MTMNYTQLPIRDEYLPGNAERREARPLGKKVAKKRRQAGLVADGRRASPRTNVIAVRCGPGLRTRKLEGTVLPLPHCRLSTLRVQWRVLARAHGGSRVTVA